MLKLYRYDISEMDRETFACLALTLPQPLLEKLDRMAHFGDKKRSLAGYLLTLGAARELCGASDPLILRTPAGKPYFAELPLCYSVSHSADFVILAASDRPIGADVEQIRPLNLGVAKRFFASREQSYVFGGAPKPADFDMPKSEQSAELLGRFYEIWTKKEAFFKQRGTGIVRPAELDVCGLPFYTESDGEYALAVYEE